MLIAGLQKLTLLDYPGKVACTVFTAGCNFRCPFCQNSDLVLRPKNVPQIEVSTILEFLKKRHGILDGVCISGGEPLMHSDIMSFLCSIKELGVAVKLDTNGSFPRVLKQLVEKELVDFVAMDIKNAPKKYGCTTGVDAFDITPIQESISFLQRGLIPFEFRTTVVKEFHSIDDLVSIGQWTAGEQPYYLQNFEPSALVIQPGLHGFKKAELMQFRDKLLPYIPHTEVRGV